MSRQKGSLQRMNVLNKIKINMKFVIPIATPQFHTNLLSSTYHFNARTTKHRKFLFSTPKNSVYHIAQFNTPFSSTNSSVQHQKNVESHMSQMIVWGNDQFNTWNSSKTAKFFVEQNFQNNKSLRSLRLPIYH